MKKMLVLAAIVLIGASNNLSFAIQTESMFAVGAGMKEITVNGSTVGFDPPAYVTTNPKSILEPRSERLLIDSQLLPKIFPQAIRVFSSPSAVVLTMPDFSSIRINVAEQTCYVQNPGYPIHSCVSEAVGNKTFVSLKSVAGILGIETRWVEKTQTLVANWKQKTIDSPSPPMSRLFEWGIVNSVNVTDSTFELRPGSSGKNVFRASKLLFDKLIVGSSMMVCYENPTAKQEVLNALWAFCTDHEYGKNYTQFFALSSFISATGFVRDLGCKPYMSGQVMMLPFQSVKSCFLPNSVSEWDGKILKYTTSIGHADLVVTVGSNEILFGTPEKKKTFTMSVATEIRDGQICVSHEILNAIGAGHVKLDQTK